MPTFKPFDVVIVPFPFTDKLASKRRPAVVLSIPLGPNNAPQYMLAMVTSAANSTWPLDVKVKNLVKAGLPSPSVVRMKFFTLDQQLILQKAGILDSGARQGVTKALQKLLPSA